MRFGRLAWGIIAAAVGMCAAAVAQALETRVLAAPTGKLFWLSFLGAGGGVLWLVDRLGLLASPYSDETLGLGHREAGSHSTKTRQQST